MVDSAGKVCGSGSVRLMGVNLKSDWWEDEVKAVLEDVQGSSNEIAGEGCMEITKGDKRKLRGVYMRVKRRQMRV